MQSIFEKLHKMRIITANEILDIFHNIQHNNHHHYWNESVHRLTFNSMHLYIHKLRFIWLNMVQLDQALGCDLLIPMRIVNILSTKIKISIQSSIFVCYNEQIHWTVSCKPFMCSMLRASCTVHGILGLRSSSSSLYTFWISDYSLFKINSIHFWMNQMSIARIFQNKTNGENLSNWYKKKENQWTAVISKCFMNSSDEFSVSSNIWNQNSVGVESTFHLIVYIAKVFDFDVNFLTMFDDFDRVCHSSIGVWNSVRLGNTPRRVHFNGFYADSSEWGMFNNANKRLNFTTIIIFHRGTICLMPDDKPHRFLLYE